MPQDHDATTQTASRTETSVVMAFWRVSHENSYGGSRSRPWRYSEVRGELRHRVQTSGATFLCRGCECGGYRESELRTAGVDYCVGFSVEFTGALGAAPDLIHVHSHRIPASLITLMRSLWPRAVFAETNVFSEPSELPRIHSISRCSCRSGADGYMALEITIECRDLESTSFRTLSLRTTFSERL